MRKINISGKYDCKANWCAVGRRGERIVAHNLLTEEEFELTEWEAFYLNSLDGNQDPFEVDGYSWEECEELYDYLDSCFLLRSPGRMIKSGGSVLYTLFVPTRKRTNSLIPKIIHFLIMISSLPLFFYSAVRCVELYGQGRLEMDMEHCLAGMIVGILLGLVLHEVGHALACLSYGGGLLEAGLIWTGLYPGAYVMIDDSRVRRRLRKVQINLAGVEMNFLLAGLSLLLLSAAGDRLDWEAWTGALFFAALENILLAVLNLSFFEGLDGEHTMSLLMGKGSIVAHARRNIRYILRTKNRQRYFAQYGITGVANICTSVVILCFQWFARILAAGNLLLILEGFR